MFIDSLGGSRVRSDSDFVSPSGEFDLPISELPEFFVDLISVFFISPIFQSMDASSTFYVFGAFGNRPMVDDTF